MSLSAELAFRFLTVLVLAYLLGGIPFTLIIGKVFYNIDPRKEGSGNLGATNSLRVLGKKAALAVAVLDVGKSTLAILIAQAYISPLTSDVDVVHWAMVGAALLAILGHAFSPYIGFKGGKGVATAAGAIITLNVPIFFILLAVFIAIIYFTRYVSLASLTIAVMYPLLVVLMYSGNSAYLIFSIIAAGLVIYFHRSNISRLRAGTESKVSFTKKETSPNG